ncbi:hypothetical protein M2139_000100 [Enterococcus sp. PF1-24]|uniref:DUF2800 domain-containing protein n=1 Tax=unclassified Enterococcus TaxID=2608891 RepID=UPI0024750B58|nr:MULTISPECIES: DUF2800 domain-containing protein [unclassified Enterococcus]MDH6363125.1 hypothetical protein [Enterococcus sp. PFB1-1]MDH6400219.1 hypothetical protein [Enterococcus sp. PF1-24]
MPNKHAVLSASSSKRWLACPPSALACAKTKDTVSEFAMQGTDAHTLSEHKLKTALGLKSKDPTENLSFFDAEMADCSDMYVQYVMEQLAAAKEKCKDPIVLIEQHLDFSKWVPEGFGTGDCVIISDEMLTVIDFKYGVGILVDAEKNPQMMCYALGALQLFDGIYDIDSVTMTIFQPRRDNVSTYTISKEELLKWADEVLSPTAQLASNGEGEYKAGDHCQFCKVKATCRKRAEHNLELARYDFEMPSVLEDDEIEVILSKADALVSWVGDIKEYALGQAVSGKEWKDWKIVEGRSNRKYVNETAVAETVKDAGYDPYEHKVLGITAMTKLLGKAKFEELLSACTHKPQGKPTLVPMTDKRQAMNINNAAKAADDFKEEN